LHLLRLLKLLKLLKVFGEAIETIYKRLLASLPPVVISERFILLYFPPDEPTLGMSRGFISVVGKVFEIPDISYVTH